MADACVGSLACAGTRLAAAALAIQFTLASLAPRHPSHDTAGTRELDTLAAESPPPS
jgi:hypothetical protein